MTTAVREKPIIFSAPMVKAILEGRKTQTRRVIKPQFGKTWGQGVRHGDLDYSVHVDIMEADRSWKWIRCPYGKSGTRLWVRETRITLEITGVRVERVQDISEEDAIAEGVNGGCTTCGRDAPYQCYDPIPDHRDAFIWLWDSINGKKPGFAWKDNPWVWALTFKRLEAP